MELRSMEARGGVPEAETIFNWVCVTRRNLIAQRQGTPVIPIDVGLPCCSLQHSKALYYTVVYDISPQWLTDLYRVPPGSSLSTVRLLYKARFLPNYASGILHGPPCVRSSMEAGEKHLHVHL